MEVTELRIAFLLLLSLLIPSISAKLCGETKIPVRLAVTASGSLQMGCSKPTCFREKIAANERSDPVSTSIR